MSGALEDLATRCAAMASLEKMALVLARGALLKDRALIASCAKEAAADSIAWAEVVELYGAAFGPRFRDLVDDAVKVEAKARAVAAKAAAAALRLAAKEEAPPPLAEELDRDDLPASLKTPDGWRCSTHGIGQMVWAPDLGRFELSPVSARPILVTGLLLDVDSDRRELVVEWRRERGGWASATVAPSTTQDPRAFVALRDLGAPVSLGNARELAGWLDEFAELNGASLPTAAAARRLGWVGDGSRGFLWGWTLISAAGDRPTDLPPAEWGENFVRLALPEDDGRAQLASGFRARGTIEGWRAAIGLILDHPRVLIAVYASLAAAFLGPVVPEAPNAIVDWSGETSRGKTTTLKVGASCWGGPELGNGGILRSWDSSPSAIEQLSEVSSCVPLFLDDTKRAEARDPDAAIVSSLIYQVAAGQGRGRARPDGMRATLTWRTILLSTGERPATSNTNDAGARARVLSIQGSPLPSDSALVARLTAGIIEHHGHAGPAIVRRLAANPDAWPEIRAAYAARVAHWTVAAGGSQVAGRLAQTLALIELGALALHDWLDVPRPADDPLRSVALAAATANTDDADRATAALAAVYGWAVQHQSEFWGRHQLIDLGAGDNDPGNAKQPNRGWAGVWRRGEWEEIAFVPDVLRRVLSYLSFSPDDVLPLWRERGWTPIDGKHSTLWRRPAGVRLRCVVLPKDVFGRALGELPAEVAPGLPLSPVHEPPEDLPEFSPDAEPHL